MFKIEAGDTAYRIVGPKGEEGEAVNYGAPAFLKIGSRTYMAFLDPPVNAEGDVTDEDWDPSQQTDPVPARVFSLGQPEATMVDDNVEFEFEEDEDGEGNENEEEEEEEGVQAGEA